MHVTTNCITRLQFLQALTEILEHQMNGKIAEVIQDLNFSVCFVKEMEMP